MNTTAESRYLLKAILQRIESNLLEQALADIKPKLLENIRATLAEMEPIIRQQQDALTKQLVFTLIVKEPSESISGL